MASATVTRTPARTGGWAGGLAAFAGALMILIGFFQFFEGLAAVIKDSYYVIGPGYAYHIDTTAWGWIHLIVGAIVCAAGFGVLAARLWARIVGITIALISAFVQFLYIPYYPLWAVLIIALDIACIWALTTYAEGQGDY